MALALGEGEEAPGGFGYAGAWKEVRQGLA